MIKIRQLNFRLEIKLLCNQDYRLSNPSARPENISITHTSSPKLGYVYLLQPLRNCNIIRPFQTSWSEATGCCSLWTGASEMIQNPPAVTTTRAAIYHAAIWDSGNESRERYQRPQTSSCSEVHDDDNKTDSVELVCCLSSQITKGQ